MRSYENKLISDGIKIIAGTDEVGRGPLAGPLVAAAVVLPNNLSHILIKDSKALSKLQLETMDKYIRDNALCYSIEVIDVETIDKLNVKASSKLAMKNAVNKLSLKPDHVLVDYEKLEIDISQTSIIHGDALSISIAAASIIAKVTRDKIMIELDKDFPAYDFKNNMGYGTKKHLDAIEKNGWTEVHRKSYNPVKTLILQKKKTP